MPKRQFDSAERHAIYSVHGEKCYLCMEPLDLGPSFHVDHIIPEFLMNDPDELAKVLKEFGLPGDFDLNSYANLKPSHIECNLRKGKTRFKATPLIQAELHDAAAKAPKIKSTIKRTVSDKRMHKIVEELFKAKDQGNITKEVYQSLGELITYQDEIRSPEMSGAPLNYSPLLKLIKVANGTMHLEGPNGLVGQRPVGDLDWKEWDCPNCNQQTAWSGMITCILCGYRGDPYD